MKHLIRSCTAIVIAAVLAMAPVAPVHAIFVFDGANFGQNLMIAFRTFRMITNQIRQIQNEANMLVNQAKHLQKMDYSALARLNQSMDQINQLMEEAEGIAFEVQAAEEAFARYYPKEYQDTVTNDELAADAKMRWSHSMDAYRQTLRVQSQVSQGIAADQDLLTALVNQSQSAVGTLQVQQATNQLIALTAQQTVKTQQLLAAQYRAEALDQARRAAAQEQARAAYRRFLGDGEAYTPAR